MSPRSSRKIGRRILRIVILIVTLLVLLVGLQLTVLAVPQLFFQQQVIADSVVIYHNSADQAAVERIAAEVDLRLRGSGFASIGRTDRVFLFQSPRRFALFARLALLSPDIQGFALSIFDNAYINNDQIAALARTNNDVPRYSIREGSTAHIVAHEVGHLYLADRIGRSAWRRLPHWKQEGIPEYIANIDLMHRDSTGSLARRRAILEDDANWGRGRQWDRTHYEALLLVEFLIEVRGFTLADLVADSVTRAQTRRELAEWIGAQSSSSGSLP